MPPKLLPALLLLASTFPALAQNSAQVYLTNPDRSALLASQTPIPLTTASPSTAQTITVDPTQTFQTMDGFGFALTGGSAQLLTRMSPDKRLALLHELFSADSPASIGVSYLRLSIGASDMNDHVFSYDDLPPDPTQAQAPAHTHNHAPLPTDPNLTHFSLGPDRTDVIPVLKQILQINPKIKILGSPWSAPLWMKTNGGAQGGVLKPEFFPTYANYFVKYIQAMQAEGITIDAITVQNEPLNEKNTPSMLMLDSEQDVFIKENLGPALQKAGLQTKIILYDHNLDHPLYPLSILRDPAAAKFVAGTGFHLYGGTVDAMTEVHNAFPNKNIYFTEQSVTERTPSSTLNLSRPVAYVIVGVSRNWSKNILLWNLSADPQNGPHTDNGGCTGCVGALTIDGDNVTRQVAFYTLAHASKFVPPGSVRIGSNTLDALPNVAFRTPEGRSVLIVSNPTPNPQTFTVQTGTQSSAQTFPATLPPGAVATYTWSPSR